jgi:hypothetical protein
MALFKFNPDDIFINTLEAYPEFTFHINSGTVYFDSLPHRQGANADVANGYVSLYQLNNDRAAAQQIYPVITKGGSKTTFKSYTDAQYNVLFNYDGEDVTGSYNYSGSIFRDFYATDSVRPKVASLRQTFNHHKLKSPQFAFSSSFGNKQTQEMSVVNIPSIFYGQRIKKGSVKLEYYVSGTLIGTLEDENYTGELIQTGPAGSTGSGSVAGTVLYKEGILAITGTWALGGGGSGISYVGDGGGFGVNMEKWTHFGDGLHQNLADYTNHLSASFNLEFQGVTHTNTMTLLAHAKHGELNYSNNPTFKDYGHSNNGVANSGSFSFVESKTPPANVTHTELTDITPTLEKETYISKVALYDKDKNLIGFAKVATPVRKTEERQYIFKLKLDL